jgi:hypothetical protein
VTPHPSERWLIPPHFFVECRHCRHVWLPHATDNPTDFLYCPRCGTVVTNPPDPPDAPVVVKAPDGDAP